MKNFYDRLAIAVSRHPGGFDSLKNVLGTTTYYRWRKREGQPSQRAAKDVAAHLGVSLDWLLEGKGSMEVDADLGPRYSGEAMRVMEESPAARRVIREAREDTLHTLIAAMTANEVMEVASRILLDAELGDVEAGKIAREILEIRKTLCQ